MMWLHLLYASLPIIGIPVLIFACVAVMYLLNGARASIKWRKRK
jgi:hypothetical protein